MGDPAVESSDGLPPADLAEPLPLLEVLGEHLYTKVSELQGTLGVMLDVAKLTGVLLELGDKQVLKLLQDEKLLRRGVERVMEYVPSVSIPVSTRSRSKGGDRGGKIDADLQEHLYSQVCHLEPELAAHITGMLLELPATQVKSLLESATRLTRAVSHAKAAYLSHSQTRQKNSPPAHGHCELDSDWSQRLAAGGRTEAQKHEEDVEEGEKEEGELEEMGERVYTEAERLYPGCAAKLTGMVLDMGQKRVKTLLQDQSQLHRVLHMAFSSLSPAQQSHS
ncbi:uncharacterized protein LOC143289587 [Babylonia areolata]|uniref:uncharacterized protein LOC143289587 n=1 Tax=Babylonia areolata TaxID=304850 RepID=UPI003FD234D8